MNSEVAIKTSPSAGKNAGIVLVPCHAWNYAPTAISGGVDISKALECHWLRQVSSQWRLLYSLRVCFFSYLFLTQRIMAVSSKVCNPDNFELDNFLKTLTNIRGLPSDFVECESFLEWNSPDIFALCDKNLDDLIDSGNFSVRSYLPLTWQGYGRQRGYFTSPSVLFLFPLPITFFIFMHSFWCYLI